MEHPAAYRNKTSLPCAGTADMPVLGFYAPRSHQVIPAADCPNAMPPARDIAQAFLAWMRRNRVEPYREESHTGLIRHLVLGADPLDQPVPEPNVRIPVHPIRPVAGNDGVHVLQQRAHSPTSLYGQYTMIPPVDFRLVLWAGPWYNKIVLEERK
jgi:hypothetical protein